MHFYKDIFVQEGNTTWTVIIKIFAPNLPIIIAISWSQLRISQLLLSTFTVQLSCFCVNITSFCNLTCAALVVVKDLFAYYGALLQLICQQGDPRVLKKFIRWQLNGSMSDLHHDFLLEHSRWMLYQGGCSIKVLYKILLLCRQFLEKHLRINQWTAKNTTVLSLGYFAIYDNYIDCHFLHEYSCFLLYNFVSLILCTSGILGIEWEQEQ